MSGTGLLQTPQSPSDPGDGRGSPFLNDDRTSVTRSEQSVERPVTLLMQADQQRAEELERRVSEMEEERQQLESRLKQLNGNYTSLQNDHEQLKEKHHDLVKSDEERNEELQKLRRQKSQLEEENVRLSTKAVNKQLYESLFRQHKRLRDKYHELIEESRTNRENSVPKKTEGTVSKVLYDILYERHAELRANMGLPPEGNKLAEGEKGPPVLPKGRVSSSTTSEDLCPTSPDGKGVEGERTLEDTLESRSDSLSPRPALPIDALSLTSLTSNLSAQQVRHLPSEMDALDKGLDSACCQSLTKQLSARAAASNVRWTKLEPLPDTVSSQCCAAVWCGDVYLAASTKGERSKEKLTLYTTPTDLSGWQVSDIVPPDNTTTPIAMVTDDERDRLLMVTLQAGCQADVVWALDGRENFWHRVTTCSFPEDRRDCMYKIVSRNTLVAAGGTFCKNNESSRDVAAFDMKTKTWRKWPRLGEARRQGRLVLLDKSLLVLGGYNPNNFTPVTKIRALDLAKADSVSGKWRSFQVQCPGSSGAISTAHHVIVCGGSSAKHEALSQVNVWSAALNQWVELPVLTVPRSVPELVCLESKILCIGGCWDHQQYTNIMEQLILNDT